LIEPTLFLFYTSLFFLSEIFVFSQLKGFLDSPFPFFFFFFPFQYFPQPLFFCFFTTRSPSTFPPQVLRRLNRDPFPSIVFFSFGGTSADPHSPKQGSLFTPRLGVGLARNWPLLLFLPKTSFGFFPSRNKQVVSISFSQSPFGTPE